MHRILCPYVMKRIFLALACALSVTLCAYAQQTNKFAFTVEGPERSYNQIRVINHTSQENFSCRVLILDEYDEIIAQHCVLKLKEYDDGDSEVGWIDRGTRLGIQLPKDFPTEVSFAIEYRDYPFYDVIVIYLRDNNGQFDEVF